MPEQKRNPDKTQNKSNQKQKQKKVETGQKSGLGMFHLLKNGVISGGPVQNSVKTIQNNTVKVVSSTAVCVAPYILTSSV